MPTDEEAASLASPSQNPDDHDFNLREARAELTNCKRNHTRACNSFIKKLHVLETIPDDKKLYFEQEINKSKLLLDRLNRAYINYAATLDHEDEGDLDTNHDLQDSIEEMYYTKLSKNSCSNHLPIDQSSVVKPKLNVPNLQPFNNSIRGYNRFKSEFRTHYEKYYSVHAHLVLKNNLLCGHSKDLCASANSVDEVFQILDMSYGDSGKLIEVVLSDIEMIPHCSENSVHDLKRLRNAIQLARVDLRSSNVEKMVTQYQTAVLIVRKLAPSVQRRWAEVIAKNRINTEDRFDKLMEFLDVEIRTMELLTNNYPSTSVPPQRKQASSQSSVPGPIQTAAKINNHGKSSKATNRYEFSSSTSSNELPKCLLHKDSQGHYFSQCRNFRSMSKEDKINILTTEAKDYCRSCLRNTHASSDCDIDIKCRKCSKRHFTFLHDALSELSSNDKRPHSYRGDTNPTGHSISPYQQVHVMNNGKLETVNLLWDTGSNISLILAATRERYGFEKLDEEPSSLNIETMGGSQINQQSQRCKVPLYNAYGELVAIIIAYEINSIGTIDPVDLTSAFDIFNISAEERNVMIHPTGEINVLIGADNAHLVLRHVAEVDGLRLSESNLGKLIWGTHVSFENTSQIRRLAAVVKLSTGQTQRKKSQPKSTSLLDSEVRSLFDSESMGVEIIHSPLCGRCACGQCLVDGSTMTLQETFEYHQIKSSIKIEDGTITASYPYRRNLATLPDNYELALRRLEQIEKKLQKLPELAVQYDAQFQDMINRGKMRLLTPEEIESWNGAVQYLPHNYVLKQSSSTPCRLIFDPSSKYKGHSVNDYWGRGPNLVNDQFGVSLRFREYPVALYGDIQKMYHTVKTTPVEWHLHRVLWRNMQTNLPPNVYIITCNSFGSGPAGAVAIIALFHLAELKQAELPRAASTILNQSYVDDLLDSTKTVTEAESITRDVDEILSLGGFKIKKWTIVDSSTPTQQPSQPVTDCKLPITTNDSVLGLSYDTGNDEFYFRVHLNFTKKKRGIRIGEDLKKNEIFDETKIPRLTKRLILSQVHSIFDPMGFLAPFIVELKFAMGKLWRITKNGKTLGWDDHIPPDHESHWRHLFATFFDLETIRVPRAISSHDSTGQPMLIAFSDSSMIAFGACIYIRWEKSSGDVFVRLVSAKSRMWPIDPEDYISVCRGELQAAVLAKRLTATIIRETRFEFSDVIYCIDSEIVFAQIRLDSHSLSSYVGPRVAEIKSTSTPAQWFICSGKNNTSADLLSRGTIDTSLLDHDSEWQGGPKWLYYNRELWPITQHTSARTPIPELRAEGLKHRTMITSISYDNNQCLLSDRTSSVKHIMQTIGESTSTPDTLPVEPQLRNFSDAQRKYISSIIDLTRHDNLSLWLAVTYRILYALSWQKGDQSILTRLTELRVISATQREEARIFWLHDAQRQLKPKIKSGQLKTLTPFTGEDGIIRCNRRSSKTSDYRPILLPHSHPISRLIVIDVHRRGHTGATTTASKVRAEYHILQLRKLSQAVRNSCQLCKLIEKKLMTAPMGSLPVSRVMKSYPFENCSCDLFGPFYVYYPIQTTRNRKPVENKAYGLIITCLSTRAIHIELMIGQDTNSFLSALRRFICIRGQPRSMFSDQGGQLVSADSNLQSLVYNFDHEKLQQYGAMNGITWRYSSPGSPWQNGISESLIRSVKRTLSTITSQNNRLQIMELQTVFYEVAELLNERPINLGHAGASGSDFDSQRNSYLCPNQLLLGRSSVRIPSGPFEPVHMSHPDRLLAIQSIVTDWWSRWTDLYLPTLIRQSKWFEEGRSAKVGDIVYVRDLNPIRGVWNVAEIIEIRTNANGVPINVLVRYKTTTTGSDYTPTVSKTTWRDVKNLSLIVPAEKRTELNSDAPSFTPHRSVDSTER